jgi:hypothetical protein
VRIGSSRGRTEVAGASEPPETPAPETLAPDTLAAEKPPAAAEPAAGPPETGELEADVERRGEIGPAEKPNEVRPEVAGGAGP